METNNISPALDITARNQGAPANPWRVPASTLQQGKYHSIIIDRGELKKAVPGSNNQFLFSESGAGIQALVIVGTSLQIMDFLLSRQNQGIDNQIASLPDIYMGISPFKPQQRFSGIFPIGDTLAEVAKFFAGLIPVPDWVSLVTAPTSLDAMRKSLTGLSDAQKQKGELLYVKFSYLPEDGMQKIGRKTINFKQVLLAIQERYKKR